MNKSSVAPHSQTREQNGEMELAGFEETGLTNEAYTSPEYYEEETRKIFRKTWMLVGFKHELKHQGDILPKKIGGIPMILVRDKDDEIRAFHNVCVHRGVRLVNKECSKSKLITCPYHKWTYDLKGRVRSRPHFYGGNKHDITKGGRDDVTLRPIRCETWHDLIFANVSGDAEPLEEYLRPLTSRTAEYDVSKVRHANLLEFESNANWKLIAENHIDALHIFSVHPELNKFANQGSRARTDVVEGSVFYGSYQFPNPEEGRGLGLPHYPGLSKEASEHAPWFYLFPNVMGQFYPDQLLIIQLIPEANNFTRDRLSFYFVGDAADDEEHLEARDKAYKTFWDIMMEDVPICEELQLGRESDGFDGGVMSPYWDTATIELAKLARKWMA